MYELILYLWKEIVPRVEGCKGQGGGKNAANVELAWHFSACCEPCVASARAGDSEWWPDTNWNRQESKSKGGTCRLDKSGRGGGRRAGRAAGLSCCPDSEWEVEGGRRPSSGANSVCVSRMGHLTLGSPPLLKQRLDESWPKEVRQAETDAGN